MMMKRILFVVTFPPPVHGSAVMSQYIKDNKLINEAFYCDYINLSTSRRIDEIGKSNPIKIWRLFTALMLLIWKLVTKRYDLCYLAITCHGIGFLKDVPFVLLCKVFGQNVVIHQHNKGMSMDVDRWPYSWLMPLAYKNIKVILLSQRLYPDVEKVVPKENVYICPNGIPVVDYEYKGRDNEVPHLLFLSNLMESKGVFALLDALKILKGNGYPFICDFVGGETNEIDRVLFEKEVDKRDLRQLVSYRGRKLSEEKWKYLSDADVFVFPTYYPNECFPLVLLEAMQFGLPIVTTDEGGIPDMIEDGVNGLICKKGDAKSLALCLEKLIDDEHLRRDMGNLGYQKYKKEYTLDCFEERLLGILKDCIL